MPLPRPLALATLALAALVALYLVFSPSSTAPLPLHYDHQPTPQQPPFLPSPPTAIHHPKRIAIVGAGASGSSAAFFLSRAARATHGEGAVELVVFERDGRVGGRSTTVKAYGPDGADGEGAADDDEGRGNPVELGASIFVDANRNLMRAVSHFNLSLVPFGAGDGGRGDRPSAGHDPVGMGLWDGARFVLTTSSSLSWWDKTKLLYRYGIAPVRSKTAVRALVDRFGQLYEHEWMRANAPWGEVDGLSAKLGLGGPEEVTGERWFRDVVSVGERWVREMVDAVVRVNYAQDVTQAHGLAAAVSLAAAGASAVKGGNWQIFLRFLRASGAEVRLHTRVDSITGFLSPGSSTPQFAIASTSTLPSASSAGTGTSTDAEVFDAVFFAGPFHQSGVTLLGTLAPAALAIPEQPYVRLHTTLLSTTSPSLSPAYFNLGEDAVPPSTVLTTSSSAEAEPEMQSITYHGLVDPDLDGADEEEGEREWIVKIFSKERRTDAWLASVFGAGAVRWVRRKEWLSYPLLPPTTTFPPVRPAGPTTPFFYLASLEPWVSTMETQTLSARNAVGLLVREWWGLGMGGCEVGKGDEGGWDWTC